MRAIKCVCISAVALLVATFAQPVCAQEQLTPPEQQIADLLNLAQAYQSNYLELVAICCFQLYASTGVVATDYANGYISGETAMSALDSNQLLQSCCFTTLSEIVDLTPADDELLHAEAGRLLAIISAEGDLLTALRDVCLDPSDDNAARAEDARRQVETLLDEYTSSSLSAADNADIESTR
jgi:hypothetical protein